MLALFELVNCHHEHERPDDTIRPFNQTTEAQKKKCSTRKKSKLSETSPEKNTNEQKKKHERGEEKKMTHEAMNTKISPTGNTHACDLFCCFANKLSLVLKRNNENKKKKLFHEFAFWESAIQSSGSQSPIQNTPSIDALLS